MSAVYIKTRRGTKGLRYLVYFRRGGRGFPEEYGGSFKFEKEARLRRDLIAGELAAGRDPRVILEAIKAPDKPKPSLASRWDEFMASRVDVGVKAQNQYRNSRDRWVPLLGESRDPGSITVEDLIAGVADLHDAGAGLAASTIGQYVSSLALVLDFCGIEPNPVRSPRLKLPRGGHGERAIPGNKTWFSIRDMTPKRSRICLELEEACAFRVSEVTGMQWGDIDFPSGMVRVRRADTKTAAGRRWVPVPEPLLQRIDGLLPLEDRRADRKVLGVRSNLVYDDLKRASELAGAPRYGTHALRHRRISLWLRHGIDPVQVARWSGHSKPSESLNTYGHVILDPLGDEWRDFWISTYNAERRVGAAHVLHGEQENA